MSVLRRMTWIDWTVVLGLLVLAVFLLAGLRPGPPGEKVVVERKGRIIFTSPLDKEGEIRLEGVQGEVILAIREGSAEMIEASCPRKLCMGMGRIDKSGEMIACVPNGLLVRIEGEEAGEKNYDILSR